MKSIKVIVCLLLICSYNIGRSQTMTKLSTKWIELEGEKFKYLKSQDIFMGCTVTHQNYYEVSLKQFWSSRILSYSSLGLISSSVALIYLDKNLGQVYTSQQSLGFLGLFLSAPLGISAIILNKKAKKNQDRAIGMYNHCILSTGGFSSPKSNRLTLESYGNQISLVFRF